jgi:hypothetical protein
VTFRTWLSFVAALLLSCSGGPSSNSLVIEPATELGRVRSCLPVAGLPPPVPGGLNNFHSTPHFRIRYATLAPPPANCVNGLPAGCYQGSTPGIAEVPDFVEDMGRAAEIAYNRISYLGYSLRPVPNPADDADKIFIDILPLHLEKPEDTAIALPGDVLYFESRQWFHLPGWTDYEALKHDVHHEVFHLAQLRAYAPGLWARDGSDWFSSSIFKKAGANTWLMEATATSIAVNLAPPPAQHWGAEKRLLQSMSFDWRNGYPGFAFFQYLATHQPSVADMIRGYFNPTNPWFTPGQLPAMTDDDFFFERLKTLVNDAGAFKRLMSDFSVAYHYQRYEPWIAGLHTWGWPDREPFPAGNSLTGYERRNVPGAPPPLRQLKIVGDHPNDWLSPGNAATFVIDLKKALCPTPGPTCNGPNALPLPRSRWQLALGMATAADSFGAIYRVRTTQPPEPAEVAPIELATFSGVQTLEQSIYVDLTDFAEDDKVVVVVFADYAAASRRKEPRVEAYFGQPARTLSARSGNNACITRGDKSVECIGGNYAAQCAVGTPEPPPNSGTVTPHYLDVFGPALVPGDAPLLGIDWLASGGVPTEMHCAKMPSGEVRCWGRGGALSMLVRATPVPALFGALSIGVSQLHHCMVKANGEVWCAGSNTAGELGIGSTGGTSLPLSRALGIDNAVEVAVTAYASCARLATGQVKCWGENVMGGLLGVGSVQPTVPTPSTVVGLTAVRQISMGSLDRPTICATRTNDEVLCWGRNLVGQVGDGTTTNRTSPTRVIGQDNLPISARDVQTSGRRTCARRPDGKLMCWGMPNHGALGTGTSCVNPCPQTMRADLVQRLDKVTEFGLAVDASWAIQGGHVYHWGQWQADSSMTSFPTPRLIE